MRPESVASPAQGRSRWGGPRRGSPGPSAPVQRSTHSVLGGSWCPPAASACGPHRGKKREPGGKPAPAGGRLGWALRGPGRSSKQGQQTQFCSFGCFALCGVSAQKEACREGGRGSGCCPGFRGQSRCGSLPVRWWQRHASLPGQGSSFD